MQRLTDNTDHKKFYQISIYYLTNNLLYDRMYMMKGRDANKQQSTKERKIDYEDYV